MTTRTDAAARALLAEVCPVCASMDVRAVEPRWFALDLERDDELRDPVLEFTCRECGTRWD